MPAPTQTPSFGTSSFLMPNNQILLPASISPYSMTSIPSPRLSSSYALPTVPMPSTEPGIHSSRPRAVSDAELMSLRHRSIDDLAQHRPAEGSNDQVCYSPIMPELLYREFGDDYFDSGSGYSNPSEEYYTGRRTQHFDHTILYYPYTIASSNPCILQYCRL